MLFTRKSAEWLLTMSRSSIINLIENCEKAKYSRSSDSAMNKDSEDARKVVGIIMNINS